MEVRYFKDIRVLSCTKYTYLYKDTSENKLNLEVILTNTDLIHFCTGNITKYYGNNFDIFGDKNMWI